MGVTRRGDGIAEPPRQPPQDHLSRTTPRRRSRETAAGGGGAENSSSAPLSKIGSERGFNRPRNLSNVFPRAAPIWRPFAPVSVLDSRGGGVLRGWIPPRDARKDGIFGRSRAESSVLSKNLNFSRERARHTHARSTTSDTGLEDTTHRTTAARANGATMALVDFPNAERTHERVERGDPIERERRTKRGCFEVRRVRADRRGTRRDAVARAVPALPAPRARRDRLRALTPDPPSRARSPQTPPRRPHGLSLAPSTMTCQRC